MSLPLFLFYCLSISLSVSLSILLFTSTPTPPTPARLANMQFTLPPASPSPLFPLHPPLETQKTAVPANEREASFDLITSADSDTAVVPALTCPLSFPLSLTGRVYRGLNYSINYVNCRGGMEATCRWCSGQVNGGN